MRDGKEISDYHQTQLPEYSVAYIETQEGQIIVEKQYKHGTRQVNPLLPAGIIDPQETPLQTTQRELLEETGYQAEDWEPMGIYLLNANYGYGKAHLFKATNARRVVVPRSGDLEEIEILPMLIVA